MIVYNSIEEFEKTGKESQVALGFFDGVHLGHREVIGDCIAEKGDRQAVVLTFAESPAKTLGKNDVSLIVSNRRKIELMEEQGADAVIFADFLQLRDMAPEAFFTEILCKKLRAKKVCCGYNYRFGKHGSGDIGLLKTLCEKSGVALSVREPVFCDGRPVSSSAIRELLQSGELEAANRMLAKSFAITGDIGEGNHLGTAMGFPTVNIPIDEGLTVPRYGVYAARVTVGGKTYHAATNIGVHPTVGANDQPICESFLLDYSGEDLYGEYAKCELIRFIRPEKRFGSEKELAEQVGRDIETVKTIL